MNIQRMTVLASATALIAIAAACTNHQGGVSPKTHTLYTKDDLGRGSYSGKKALTNEDRTNTWSDYTIDPHDEQYNAPDAVPLPETSVSGGKGTDTGRTGVYGIPVPETRIGPNGVPTGQIGETGTGTGNGTAGGARMFGGSGNPQDYGMMAVTHQNRSMRFDSDASMQVSALNGVRSANVIATDRNAYVAVVLQRGNPVSLPDLRDRIANVVMSVSPSARMVYMSSDPEFVNKVNSYVLELRGGTPMESLLPEFNALTERWFPTGTGLARPPES